jgi:hypothetical protein
MSDYTLFALSPSTLIFAFFCRFCRRDLKVIIREGCECYANKGDRCNLRNEDEDNYTLPLMRLFLYIYASKSVNVDKDTLVSLE